MFEAYDYLWSRHSLEKIKDRFEDQDIMPLINSVVIANKNTKRKIRKTCPITSKIWMKGYTGRYYLYNRKHGIIFVISAPNTVVTVFKLEKEND